MRKHISNLLTTIVLVSAFHVTLIAQTTGNNKDYISLANSLTIDCLLTSYKLRTNSIYKKNETYLVSTYTFRAMVQKDFSKITIGENSFSKAGRFATLNINSDESKFYLTPFTFIVQKDPTKGSFKYIHSVDFSGEINDKNIFDFENKKSLKAGYSFTWVFSSGYTPKDKRTPENEKMHEDLVNLTYSQLSDKYRKAATSLADFLEIADDINQTDEAKTKEAVKKRFFKKLEDYETKYYEDKWKKKKLSWLKANITPFSWDNFSYIDPKNSQTYTTPADKSVYSGNIKVSYNELYTFLKTKNSQIYWSVYATLTRKHSLSEISKPSQWYSFKNLTDSTVTVKDDKKAYSLTESDFKTGIRPDIGGQFIYIFDAFENMGIGIDLASSFSGLVTSEKNSYLNKTSLGILFPFLDKDGESTINVEGFYQRKSYINSSLKGEGFVGIKFGLPFHML